MAAVEDIDDTIMQEGDEQSSNEDRRITIRVQGNAFIPSHIVTRSITSIWKARFTGAWDTWTSVPQDDRNVWFDAFKAKHKWDPRHEDVVRRVFKIVGAKSLRNFMSKARMKETEKPEFMHNSHWQTLCKKWKLPEFIAKSKRCAVARQANKRLHTGGSVSNIEHTMRLKKELKRDPSAAQLFERTHKRKNKTFVNDEARETWERYNEKYGVDDALDAQSGNMSNTYRRWADHVGSKNGSYYGFGSGVDGFMLQGENDEEDFNTGYNEDFVRVQEMVEQHDIDQVTMKDQLESLKRAQEAQSRKIEELLESQTSNEQNLKKFIAQEVSKAVAQDVGKIVAQEIAKSNRQLLAALRKCP